MNSIMENKTDLETLRNEIVIKLKKGLPFIGASVVIWLLILIVIILDLPQDKENLLVFCCSCPLLPISWIIGKVIKVDIFDKSNPLGNVGFLFTCNQFLYLLIVMWVFSAVPNNMVMVYAMVFGAHLLPYSWLSDFFNCNTDSFAYYWLDFFGFFSYCYNADYWDYICYCFIY